MTSREKPLRAIAKSTTCITLDVNIGSYSAAAKMPTTAALMPVIALAACGLFAIDCHKGRAAEIKRRPGKNIKVNAMVAPSQLTDVAVGMMAPR